MATDDVSPIKTFGNTGGPDPRCPYCGRPVLGAFVQGNEGRYHVACTLPPFEPQPPSVPPIAPFVPHPYPWDPWTCGTTPTQAELDGTIRAETNHG